ncbi:M15 family metallopeptidase [Clostridium sardiniense]|uniref:M15 family metallopeptidase n=1 Tax=Clostridium sardiniense TaxID=29369 RepID=UPI001958135F|nr:M15 family metallopeptidase [Clostridium sardiniense]MBM7833374.1 D-alanyl-D-alanine carboxypeptidase [Clostridium sardiniense]
MKSGLKKVLAFIIIIIGILYMLDFIGMGSRDINNKKNIFNLKGAEMATQTKSPNLGTELILVNRKYGLSKYYEPEDSTIPNIEFTDEATNEEKHVAGIVVKPLEDMVNTAKEEGIILLGNSAYRSYRSQTKTYNNRVEAEGRERADAYVARPGFSEHQTGLCIDITNRDKYFAQGTKEADWLANNCYKFGFIIRYPYGKKNVTGIEYEPWHVRYVGKKAAKDIYDNKITLEEYLGK